MSWEPETLAQYHDLWASLILRAPDSFHNVADMTPMADQKAALVKEFERLLAGFHFAIRKIKDEHVSHIAKELITMSFESYIAGDKKAGAHMLQEARGLVWPRHQLRIKYGVEAERRAFGKNLLYANVLVSPYPYEGTVADLGPDQTILLEIAVHWFKSYNELFRDFKYFSWVIDAENVVRRTSIEPKDDDHPLLKPLQKSWGYKRLKELGRAGDIQACVLVQYMPGLVIFDLEQRGKPRVSARQLFSGFGRETEYGQIRFHLEDPEFITDE
ncbi:hypothetical protein NT2_01_04040 [Caenibius tardaugens NBRC 16725]|uniref:Uncharacterized protein n=2 Tax=Caenibius TaxID=2827482 RepID=U2ZYM9_9SPHN|nr:hypothetical protein [Caenibius tardaugens]GAD47633.1 hypothetical protein NT2_01_04040 [Caenibius tardaugens NBRC 16725]